MTAVYMYNTFFMQNNLKSYTLDANIKEQSE